MKLLLAIACGGAIGALARHSLAAYVMRLTGGGFPYGTVVVNVLGSFLLGALVEVMALRWNVGLELRAFLTVGILGAFTTFSTFSLDVALLVQRNETLGAFAYAGASVVLSLLGLFLGLYAIRVVLT